MSVASRYGGVTPVVIGLLIVVSTIGGRIASAAASDDIRALRLANDRAIARHDMSGMRAAWDADIHVICCGNTLFSGAAALAASYRAVEFKNPEFVEYVRIPQSIAVSSDRSQAAEYGRWVGVFRSRQIDGQCGRGIRAIREHDGVLISLTHLASDDGSVATAATVVDDL